jgi:hypothetical protein
MSNPADLNISGKSDPSNKDYFDITINPLKLVTDYNFQFQWVFEDKAITEKVGDNWSNVFKVTTIGDSINKPQFRLQDLGYTTNTLLVSWSGKDYLGLNYNNNLARIDIHAKGGSFGANYKVVGQFTKEGTQTITAAPGQYFVKLQAVSNSGGVSLFSDERTVITESPIIVDATPPDNPTDVGVTTGVDPKDQTGFSAFAKFSWTHHPNAATNGTRAYRLRWTYDTVNPVYEYGLVDYPNNSYTATGLIPNVEYTYQVASVDQFNNTKEYYTGGTFTASDPTNPDGWARLKSYISIGGATGDLFKFGTGIPTSINTSLTTTPALTSGNYNGIILNKTGNNNNYWLTTGQIRVGGNTQFMYWDGTNLSITGDLGVGGGATIAGNVFMKTSGASIYSGTLDVNGNISGAGYILNKDGLRVQDAGVGLAQKYVRLDPATGTLFANNAQITGTIILTGGSTKDIIDAAALNNRIYRQNDQPTGGVYKSGDLWVDINDNNKIYAWNTGTSQWVLTQDSAAAKSVADQAKIDAEAAALRAQKFDTSGNLNNGLVLNTTGSIYSTKSSYDSTSTGWYIGWRELTPGNYTPAINIGGTNSYLKWTGNSLEMSGKVITTGTNPAGANGTLTIDSGWFDHSNYMYFNAQSFIAFNTPSSFTINSGVDDIGVSRGSSFTMGTNYIGLGTGTGTGDVFIQMTPTGGSNPGVNIYGIDLRSDSVANNATVGRTVTLGAGGSLAQGRALYQGAATSASTIDSLVSAANGDLYFSTA